MAESGQSKKGAAKVDRKVIEEERGKACDDDDLLIVLCTEDKQISDKDLPKMTGIVQSTQWDEYFGPYAGRAFFIWSRTAAQEKHKTS